MKKRAKFIPSYYKAEGTRKSSIDSSGALPAVLGAAPPDWALQGLDSPSDLNRHLAACWLTSRRRWERYCPIATESGPRQKQARRGGEMVNAADLKSAIAKATYGFESHPRHGNH